MKKKLLALLLAALMLVSVLAGCGAAADDSQSTQDTGTADTADTTVSADADLPTPREDFSYTDSTGRTVTIQGEISRVVVSGPMTQMLVYALAPEMLVGLSTEWNDSDAPYVSEDYLNLPLIGQLYGGKGEVNLEEVAKLDPQLLIDIGEAKGTIVEDMDNLQEQTGVTCIHIGANLETYPDAIRELGMVLGKEAQAEELATLMDTIYDNAQRVIDTVGQDNLASVVYCVGEDGLSVLAKTSYHAEMLDMLTNNVAVVEEVSSSGMGNPVSMEQLYLWDPDYIIFAPAGAYSIAAHDPAWQQLGAIGGGNFLEVPEGPDNWMGSPPSAQRYLGLIWLPAALYPESVDYNAYDEVTQFYELFYHCTLTQDMYNGLTANAFLN